MPDFEFTSPRGKTFTVTGPEGATQEQAWGMLQSQSPGGDVELYGWDPHAEETTQLSRDVGSFGRAATQAAKDFPATPGKMAGMLWDTGKGLWNTLTNFETYGKLKDPEWWKNIPSAVADEFSANWGDTERARKHFETNPIGFLNEVSIPLTGGAAAAGKAGTLAAQAGRKVLPTIGSVTAQTSAADLRLAGEAGLKGGAEAAEYKAGAAGRPLTSEAKPVAPFDDPLPAGLDIEPKIGVAKAQEAQKALAAQREAEQAKLAPYGQAGQRLGSAGASPQALIAGGLLGGRAGTAAAATAASPSAMGTAMYGLGAAERGLGALPGARAPIIAGAAELLRNPEAKKELANDDVKTLRKAARGDADSSTMLAASRILGARSTAVKSPYGGMDVGQAQPRPGAAPPGTAPEMTGETPLNLPGQSPGLGGAPAYGPSDAPKHGGKTLPEFVLAGMWDQLRTMGPRARESAWGAAEGDPDRFKPGETLEMAKTVMGRMPFAGPGTAGVGGGRLLQPGVNVAAENKHGLVPDLRVKVGVSSEQLPEKPLFTQTTTNANAPKQLEAIDTVLSKHPAPETSPEAWSQMMAHALGSDEVPVPPYAFIRDINGAGAVEKIKSLTPGQIKDADHGFANARKTRADYEAGRVSPAQTGKLFLWSFLSRGVSPYTQESLFIDAFSRVDPWIQKAVEGKFTAADVPAFKQAMADVAPKGSGQPGAGAQLNLNAFGANFLLKMGERGADGKTHLQRMHDLLSDPSKTGQQIRREFSKISEGVGIDNKVMSFTLLVAGHPDVMVLDRVQMRQLWDDGRFAGRNIYDGMKNAEGNVITGTPMSTITSGARGLLQYEAIERALGKRIKDIYTRAGRPQDASIGRYHWESWVAHSQQEASHGTLEAVMDPGKIAKVTAKEGEYGSYQYGAKYGRDRSGTPYFSYPTPSGKKYNFSIPSFRAFLEEIKKPAAGVVPRNFKVTEAGNAPWYKRQEVNRARLEDIARKWASQ
jgi:hypothetical protein